MFDKKVYLERREQLKRSVGSGMILFLGNEESSMNYKDNLYPFRQDSSFLYFFGIDRPALVGVIDIDNDSEIIFGDDFTTEEMIWTGYREPLHLLSGSIGISIVKPKKIYGLLYDWQMTTKRKYIFATLQARAAYIIGRPIGC